MVNVERNGKGFKVTTSRDLETGTYLAEKNYFFTSKGRPIDPQSRSTPHDSSPVDLLIENKFIKTDKFTWRQVDNNWTLRGHDDTSLTGKTSLGDFHIPSEVLELLMVKAGVEKEAVTLAKQKLEEERNPRLPSLEALGLPSREELIRELQASGALKGTMFESANLEPA